MNIVEVIKGLNVAIEGLTTIKNALEVSEKVDTTNADKPIAARFDKEELAKMPYNEFKKLAASLGVKCTGTRDEIMARILDTDVEIPAEAVVSEEEVKSTKKRSKKVETSAPEEVEEETDEKSNKSVGGKRKSAKKVDEPTEDEFDKQAAAIVADTPVEDIIEALAEVDVKATKRNVVAKLADALRNGLLELDADEDEDEEEVDSSDNEEDDTEDVEDDSDEESEDEDEDIESTSYFPQYDPEGFNNPDDMTEERKDAIVSKMDDILTAVSEDDLSVEDIESYIEEYATEDEIDLLGDDPDENEELKLYMELVKRTIDDDGEEHEAEDPYEIGEHEMCCGRELKYVKKTKRYVCSKCGAEYEA